MVASVLTEEIIGLGAEEAAAKSQNLSVAWSLWLGEPVLQRRKRSCLCRNYRLSLVWYWSGAYFVQYFPDHNMSQPPVPTRSRELVPVLERVRAQEPAGNHSRVWVPLPAT
jgi:hypothetical protein